MEGLFRHQHHATPPVWQSLIPRCSRLLDSTTHTAARLPTRWNRLKHSVLERTKKHKCKWPRKQARPTCGAQRWFFFFLFYVTVKRSSHAAALLESHRLNPRIDTAVPRAVQGAETCARAQEPDSCYNESFHQAVRCHQISLRPRTITSSREAEQYFTTGRKSSIWEHHYL